MSEAAEQVPVPGDEPPAEPPLSEDGEPPDAVSESGDAGAPQGRLDGLLGRLGNTDPNPELGDVDTNIWNPEDGGPNRVFRGVQKYVGTDGIPAWVDMAAGALEIWYTTVGPGVEDAVEQGGDDDDRDDEEPEPIT